MTIPMLVAVLVAVVVPIVVLFFSAAIASVSPRWLGLAMGFIATFAGIGGLLLNFVLEEPSKDKEGNPFYAFTLAGIPVAIGCFVGARWAQRNNQSRRTQSAVDLS